VTPYPKEKKQKQKEIYYCFFSSFIQFDSQISIKEERKRFAKLNQKTKPKTNQKHI